MKHHSVSLKKLANLSNMIKICSTPVQKQIILVDYLVLSIEYFIPDNKIVIIIT